MNNLSLRLVPATALVFLNFAGAAYAYDDMPEPALPADHVTAAKPTEQSVKEEVGRQVTERFMAAAGSASGLLSHAQAQAAGWGFVSDHFKEIDTAGNGYVALADVLRFVDARAPQRMRAKGGGGS